MVETEQIKKYQDYVSTSISKKEESLSEIQSINVEHVQSWRSYTSTLLTIDVGVIAGILTALSSPNGTVKNTFFALSAVCVLAFDTILIVMYSALVLYLEDKSLFSRKEFIIRSYDTLNELALKFLTQKKDFDEFKNAEILEIKRYADEESELSIKDLKREISPKWLLILSAFLSWG